MIKRCRNCKHYDDRFPPSAICRNLNRWGIFRKVSPDGYCNWWEGQLSCPKGIPNARELLAGKEGKIKGARRKK